MVLFNKRLQRVSLLCFHDSTLVMSLDTFNELFMTHKGIDEDLAAHEFNSLFFYKVESKHPHWLRGWYSL